MLQESTKEPAETSNGQAEPRYRYQFFQTPSKVEVAVLAKNLTAGRVTVDIQEQWLGVVILDERGQQVGYTFAELHVFSLCCLASWKKSDAASLYLLQQKL